MKSELIATCLPMFSRSRVSSLRAAMFPSAMSLVITTLALVWATMAATVGHAQTQTWSAAPSSGNWNVAGNWTSGTAPVGNDSLAFGSTTIATATNNFTAGTQFDGITFVSGAATYTLSGNQIALGGSVTNNSTATQTLSVPLALSATQSFVAASGSLTLSGVISGAGGLTKTGTGVLTLGGGSANTYAGTTTVSDGRLVLGKSGGANAVPSDLAISNAAVTFTAGNQIADTAAVTMSGSSSTFNTISTGSASLQSAAFNETIGSLTVAGGFVYGGGNNAAGTGFIVTGAGSFDNTAGYTDYFQGSGAVVSFDSLSLMGMSSTAGASVSPVAGRFALRGNNANLSRLIVGAGGLSLDGSNISLELGTSVAGGSRVVLNGDVTTTGAAASSIRAGSGTLGTRELWLSGATGAVTRSFTVGGGGADLTVNVPILDGTTGAEAGLKKLGLGLLTLSASNSYTGGTQINGGVLALGNADALGSTGTISFGGGTLQFSAANTTDYSNRFSTAASQAYRLDTNGQTVSLASTVTSSGGSLTKLGAGTLTLSASNSYDGGTQINGGVLALGNANALGSTGTISFGGGTLQFSAENTSDYSNRFSTAASQAYSLDTEGQTVSLVSPLTSSGGSLTKLGAGTLTLSASNTFTGSTRVVAGTLNLNNGSALVGSTLDMNANDSGSVTFATNTTLGGLGGSRDLNLGTRVISIGDNNQSTTYSGVLSNGGLTKLGSGALTLSGSSANTYSGTTTVSAGRLVLNKTAGVDAVAGNLVISNAILMFGATADNQIADSAAVTMSGTGSFFNGTTLSSNFANKPGLNETIASLDVSGGLFLPGSEAATTGFTVTGIARFTGGAGNTNYVQNSGGISSYGSLELVGMSSTAGAESASVPNQFVLVGNSAIRQTELTVGSVGLSLDGSNLNLQLGLSAGALGSRLVLNGDVTTTGTTASSIRPAGTNNVGTRAVWLSGTAGSVTRSFTVGGGGADLTVNVPILDGTGTAGIRKLGAGLLTLGDANNYTGATTISAGTLALAAGGSFATSPLITVGDTGSSGAVLDLTSKTGTFAFASSQIVGGIGTIKPGTVEFAGILAPGNSAGILTFDGGTAILSGTTQIEFFGATRGTGYDAIDLIDSAAINYGNGVLALDFGSWLADQQSYQIFGNGSQSPLGNFSEVTITGDNYTGLTFSGSSGVWTSQGTSTSGQTFTFTEATGTLVIVPEPGAFALAGLGVALAGWLCRRRA